MSAVLALRANVITAVLLLMMMMQECTQRCLPLLSIALYFMFHFIMQDDWQVRRQAFM